MAKPLPGEYQGYSADTTADAAWEAFKRRYGYPPDLVVQDRGCVKAGPITPTDVSIEPRQLKF